MLPAVVLDPSIFWLLSGKESSSESERLFVDSYNWLRRDAHLDFKVLVSGRMLDRLQVAGYFPAENHFSTILASSGLDQIVTARQLAIDVARFLSRTKALEDECEVQDGLFESITIDEDIFAEIGVDELNEISRETCALTASNVQTHPNFQHSYLYAYSRDSSRRQTISVIAKVLGVEPARYETLLGGRLDVGLNILHSPSCYRSRLDPHDVWAHASDAEELEFAITLKAEQLRLNNGGPALRKFRVGTGFMNALRNHQAFGRDSYAPLVLTKCASVVSCGENIQIQDMRTSGKRTSPARVRIRDNAQARRVKVTGGHEALRLMFWETDDRIEFACVRNKFDLSIDEGAAI